MKNNKRIFIQSCCRDLIIAYAKFLDMAEYDQCADMFEDNATLDVWSELKGKSAILAAMSARPSDLLTRHIMTNILITVIDERQATGVSYLTLYRKIGKLNRGEEKTPFTRPAAVGQYNDEFVLTKDGWRFSRRKAHFTFMNPDAFPDKAN